MLPLGHLGITFTVVRALERCFNLHWVDYRLLLVGAILPDIIDKPLGYLLSDGHVFVGKSYGHSLLFLILLMYIGLLQQRKRPAVVAKILFIGSAIHGILDVMWHFPQTLFWPVKGEVFSGHPYEAWEGIIQFGITDIPILLVLELVGGIMLLYFFSKLVLNNKLTHFIKTGKLAYSSCHFRYLTKAGN